MNNYIILLFFVIFAIISDPVTTRPSKENTISVEHVNKQCPPEPELPKIYENVKIKEVGIVFGCYDYGLTDKGERFIIPPEAVDKLQLAVSENLTVFMDLQKNYHDIAIYSKEYV